MVLTKADQFLKADQSDFLCCFSHKLILFALIIMKTKAKVSCHEKNGARLFSSFLLECNWFKMLSVSAVQHRGSATCRHRPLPPGSPSQPPPGPPGHHRAPGGLPELPAAPASCDPRGSVCMPILISNFIPPSSSPCPQIHSPRLHLYSCPASRLRCSIFNSYSRGLPWWLRW